MGYQGSMAVAWDGSEHEKGWAKEWNAASKGDMGDDRRNQPSKIAIGGIIHRQFLGQVDRANEDLIPCGILVMHWIGREKKKDQGERACDHVWTLYHWEREVRGEFTRMPLRGAYSLANQMTPAFIFLI